MIPFYISFIDFYLASLHTDLVEIIAADEEDDGKFCGVVLFETSYRLCITFISDR